MSVGQSVITKRFLLLSREIYDPGSPKTGILVHHRMMQVKFAPGDLDLIFKVTGDTCENHFRSLSQEIFGIAKPGILVHKERTWAKFALRDRDHIIKITGGIL